MAAGAPIVASDIDGFRDVLTAGVHGLLVPPQDSAALAEGLRRLLDDPAMREEMVRAAARHAMDYSWDNVSGRILRYYEDTMQARTGAAGRA
jgi:phosphatidylinositol alpha-mannosyltransferase